MVRVSSCARLSVEWPPERAQMTVSAIHFTNENASLASAASPVSGVRRIGRVINTNLRKNSANLWQRT
jgi:hypothetical protein